MAKIEWHAKARILFRFYVQDARNEFGVSTAKKWLAEKDTIEWRLEHYPTSYPLEELLKSESIPYRFCHLMHRRFKLIYFYDDATDTIHIMDIWDTRMSPTTLTKRIK